MMTRIEVTCMLQQFNLFIYLVELITIVQELIEETLPQLHFPLSFSNRMMDLPPMVRARAL